MTKLVQVFINLTESPNPFLDSPSFGWIDVIKVWINETTIDSMIVFSHIFKPTHMYNLFHHFHRKAWKTWKTRTFFDSTSESHLEIKRWRGIKKKSEKVEVEVLGWNVALDVDANEVSIESFGKSG